MFVIKYKLENDNWERIKDSEGVELTFDTRSDAENYVSEYARKTSKKQAQKINIIEVGFNSDN